MSSARNPIRRVAVLGAGTMGARIAAHVANAGFPVLLLDRVPAGEGQRNRLATQAIDSLKRLKPPALVAPECASRVTPGNFEDDLDKLKSCDWIIEAVAEDMEIKRGLLARVAEHVRADAAATTNTSGLPVGLIAKDLPEAFRCRWFGTHFFNPPHYMRLMELIATPESDPETVKAIADFAELHLGKTVVLAHDTPNFIANRIGTFAMLNTLRVMRQIGLSVEEIDTLTGTAPSPRASPTPTAPLVTGRAAVRLTCRSKSRSATSLAVQPALRMRKVPATKTVSRCQPGKPPAAIHRADSVGQSRSKVPAGRSQRMRSR